MDSKLRAQLTAHLELYDRQRADKGLPVGGDINLGTGPVQYGTAGFRGNAARIEHLFFNVGLIAALRSLQRKSNVGIMITASHNPVQDNGIKLIECNGEMLSLEWEPLVEGFCNIHDKNQILNELDVIIESHKIDLVRTNSDARILIGMDTRPSSEALASLVKQGLEAWSPLVSYIDYGHLTTPALHYLVAESTKRQIVEMPLQAYYQQLISGLVEMFNSSHQSTVTDSVQSYSPSELVIDCANGIGYETMQYLCKDENFSKCLKIELINTGDGILNKLCGADYVKTMHLPPSGADDINKRYASLDGDADRLVYFYLDNDGKGLRLNLLDGDKIMALYALYLKDLLKASQLEGQLSLGVVQTAYANGSSTDFISKELGINVDCVDTGVKNLHKQATRYDLGIYFEANGHGTIWLSDKARAAANESSDMTELKQLMEIIVNYTGDAVSDILVVETILRKFNWNIRRWFELYQDRPSSLIKVQVKDRNRLKTINAARTCIEPEGLQSFIDSAVAGFGQGARCFARASGTEDYVRIYAEANDVSSAEKLAEMVGSKVKELC